jgi:hypothetical protein
MTRTNVVLQQSREFPGETEARPPAVEATQQETYAERLRIAQDIVKRLRSAGVTCGIFNGGVPPKQNL